MVPQPCDLSDGITMVQLTKIMTDLFRISYSYPRWPILVKHKLKKVNRLASPTNFS